MSQVSRLVVVATLQGAEKVASGILGLGNAATVSNNKTSALQHTLNTLFTGAVIAGLARYSDGYINLQNKLALVTKDSAELASVTDRLFQISQKTRTGFEDTAKLYQRVALAGRDMKTTTEQNIRFTETLNKAITVSGASAIEASNAMIQLSQGLAKGVLNGDELRSVLEQLPFVADLIVKEFNRMGNGAEITRGDLRKLGAEGKITSNIVFNAVLNSGAAIDQLFSRTTVTISQALTVLSNSVINFVGKLNQGVGVMSLVSAAIVGFANNIEFFATIATSAALAYGIFLLKTSQVATIVALRSALTFIVGLFSLFTSGAMGAGLAAGVLQARLTALAVSIRALVFSNPFTAIAMGIVVVLPLLLQYQDQIKLSADGTITLGTVFRAVASLLLKGLQLIMPFLMMLGKVVMSLIVPAFRVFWEAGVMIFNMLYQLTRELFGNVASAELLKVAVIGLISVFMPWLGLGIAILNLLYKLDPGLQTTRKVIAWIGEAAALVVKIGLTPLLRAFQALVNVLGAFKLIGKEAVTSVNNTVNSFLDLSKHVQGAADRLNSAGKAASDLGVSSLNLSDKISNLSNNVQKNTSATEEASVATSDLSAANVGLSNTSSSATSSLGSLGDASLSASGSVGALDGQVMSLDNGMTSSLSSMSNYENGLVSLGAQADDTSRRMASLSTWMKTSIFGGPTTSRTGTTILPGYAKTKNTDPFFIRDEEGNFIRKKSAVELVTDGPTGANYRRTVTQSFHSGGVYQSGSARGEGFAFLRDDEEILTPEDPRHAYNAPRNWMNGGTDSSSSEKVAVNNFNFNIPAGVHSAQQLSEIQARLQRGVVDSGKRAERRGRF